MVQVIVDVQNDFISGSLAIVNCPARQDGEDVVAPINLLLDTVPFHQCYYRFKYFLEHPNIFASQMFVILPPAWTGTPQTTCPSLTTCICGGSPQEAR